MRRAAVIDLFAVLERAQKARAEEAIADDKLVARALDGDRWADEAIFRKHARYVGSLAGRLLRSRSEAEDVVQDTFALALTELPKLRDPAKLRGWLAQIAVSQVRRRFRRARLLRAFGLDRSVEDLGLADLVAGSASPEVGALLAELDDALRELDADRRIAWMLRYVEGEQLEDVAAACGCSLATAKRRITSADVHVRARVALEDG
ncbi:MAG: sigma-70 family RNA polymerase sigma factor [Polyangiaceae bacterium]